MKIGKQPWLFLALVTVWSGSAIAQVPQVASLSRDGAIAQILLNPHGEPDGLMLRDGTLVRFPPHALRDPRSLRVGALVHSEGEASTTPNGVTLFDARVSENGRVLADGALPPDPLRRPPPPPGAPDAGLTAMTATGKVRVLLADPDGIIDGFVLDDGTVVHAGRRARLSRYGLVVGTKVVVSGFGGTYAQGRSLRAETLQIAGGPTYALEAAPPRPVAR